MADVAVISESSIRLGDLRRLANAACVQFGCPRLVLYVQKDRRALMTWDMRYPWHASLAFPKKGEIDRKRLAWLLMYAVRSAMGARWRRDLTDAQRAYPPEVPAWIADLPIRRVARCSGASMHEHWKAERIRAIRDERRLGRNLDELLEL